MPCLGYIKILRSYRLTDATGVYVYQRLDGGPLAIAMTDTAERGAAFSDQDRAIIEEGAKRSPVHYMFGRTGLLNTTFDYDG